MRVRILAVGQHIADWAQEAVRGYLARFPRSWSVDLARSIAPDKRQRS